MIYRPIVLDKEIFFSKKKFIVSKTDTKGNIIFVNKNFEDISGYTEEELKGMPHNVIRHPDMPRAIFFLIWNSLKAGREVSGVIKNLAKSGKYYWVISDFSIEKNIKGDIVSFTAFRRGAPDQVIEEIEELYDEMLSIEKKEGIEGSLLYLESFLDEKKISYDEFLEELIRPKGVLGLLLNSFKNIFPS